MSAPTPRRRPRATTARTLSLPGAQAALISEVAAETPTRSCTWRPVAWRTSRACEPKVAAMLWSSYNGMRKGQALADVLLGTYDPSGRLPFTWYRGASELPPITDYAIRPTRDNPGPHVHVLPRPGVLSVRLRPELHHASASRTCALRPPRLDANGTVRHQCRGDEHRAMRGQRGRAAVRQHTACPAALQRPIKRLERFQNVSAAPGQTKTVSSASRWPTWPSTTRAPVAGRSTTGAMACR